MIFFLFTVALVKAQINSKGFSGDTRSVAFRDSQLQRLISAAEDTGKVQLLGSIAFSYAFLNSDSSVAYSSQALALSKKINYTVGEIYSLQGLCRSYSLLGKFAKALDFGMKGLSLAESTKDSSLIAGMYGNLMNCYLQQDDYIQALKFGRMAELFSRSATTDPGGRMGILGILGAVYQNTGQLDSGLYYCLKAYQTNIQLDLKWGGVYRHIGDIYFKKGLIDSAMYYYRNGIPVVEQSLIFIDLVDIYYGMSRVFETAGKTDSSIYYAQKSIVETVPLSYPEGKLRAASQLAHLYDLKNLRDSTIKYLKLSSSLREQLFSREKTREAQNIAFNEQIHQQELQQKLNRTNCNTITVCVYTYW